MEDHSEFTVRKPVRRRKSRLTVFKEAYLPYLILMLAALIIVMLIIGALVRNANGQQAQETASVPSVHILLENP